MMRQARPNRFRLAVEYLEDRTLLSAPALYDLGNYRLDPSGEYDHSRILVKFRSDAASRASAPILAGTTLGQVYPFAPGVREVFLGESVGVQQAVAAYRARPDVEYAEPNYLGRFNLIPNDPMWNNAGLYGLRNIQAPAAWDYWQGERYAVAASHDSGTNYDHPDLYLNMWINQYEIPASRLANLTDVDGDYHITFWDLNDPANQGSGKITDQNGDGRISGSDILRPMTGATGGWADGVDNESDGFADDLLGWDTGDNDNNPTQGFAHGTHVGGTIGAIGNNGVGVVGVNWRVQILPMKISPGTMGSIPLNAAVLAIYYTAWWGASVSNNSWGIPGNVALKDAIAWARTQGQLFVVAAGNSNANNDVTQVYPANYGVNGPHGAGLDNVMSILATTNTDARASFSSYGLNSVHLGAPGNNILSTCTTNTYCLSSGTSMATPHVVGAAAYLKSIYPGHTYLQIKTALMDGVDRLGLPVISGGRLNLHRSLAIAGPGGSPSPGGGDPAGEMPGENGTPGTLGGNAALIVDSLSDPGAELVQPPLRQLSTPVGMQSVATFETVFLDAQLVAALSESARPLQGPRQVAVANQGDFLWDLGTIV